MIIDGWNGEIRRPSGCRTAESPLKVSVSFYSRLNLGKENYNSQRPTVTHNNKREGGSSWGEKETDRLRKEKERERLGEFFLTSMGVFIAAEEENWRREIRSKWLKTRKWSASPKSWIKWCTRRTRWVKNSCCIRRKHGIRWWALPLTAERGKTLETQRVKLCSLTCGGILQNPTHNRLLLLLVFRIFWKKFGNKSLQLLVKTLPIKSPAPWINYLVSSL